MQSDSSSYFSGEEVQTPDHKPKSDPSSIDQSLDAIEDQLSSISMSQPESMPLLETGPEPEPEPEPSVIEETPFLDDGGLVNGQLDEELTLQSNLGITESRMAEEVKLKGSSSREWRSGEEIEEVEREPPSPSSSGYAGEPGSSSSTSGIEERVNGGNKNHDEVHEVQSNGDFDPFPDNQAPWLPGKRHINEDYWISLGHVPFREWLHN